MCYYIVLTILSVLFVVKDEIWKCKKHIATLVHKDVLLFIDGSLILEVSSLEEYTLTLGFSGDLNSTKLSKRPFWFMGDNFGSRDFFAKQNWLLDTI